MSHLNILRGKFGVYLFDNLLTPCSKTFKKSSVSSNKYFVRFQTTKSAPAALSSQCVNSQWDEIRIGNESLTGHVFSDVDKWADKPCVTCGSTGRSYDYGTVHMLADRCASTLLGGMGLKPGDRIGLILPNIPEFLILIYGAIKAGLIVTFANPLYTADEIKKQFEDCDVKAIATIEMFMPVVQTVGKSLKDFKGIIWVGGEEIDKANGVYGLRPFLMAGYKANLPEVNADDVCLIPYSSGTTGMPKGVILTHKNLVCNLKQVMWPKIMKYNGERGKGDVVLTVPPFFHIYGFNGILNYNVYLGNHIVTIPKFVPEEYLKCLVKYKPSTLFVVPSLLAFLATHPLVRKEHLQSIDTVMVGAAPTTESMVEKFLMKCEKTKEDIKMLQGYGMTETSPVLLMTPYKYPFEKIGSAGQLISSTQARIVSLSSGESLGPHKSGELWVKGPQVMKGYWNNEAATRETVDSEGWLHTGDVAYYDNDGYFYIVDRTKELIKVKGNQVSPTEIENIIMELREVADVAVVGVPDPLAGEVPKAFVVLKPKHHLTEKDVKGLVAKRLTRYKHLDGGVVFLDSIPRNAAGKILRNELKVLRYK